MIPYRACQRSLLPATETSAENKTTERRRTWPVIATYQLDRICGGWAEHRNRRRSARANINLRFARSRAHGHQLYACHGKLVLLPNFSELLRQCIVAVQDAAKFVNQNIISPQCHRQARISNSVNDSESAKHASTTSCHLTGGYLPSHSAFKLQP